MNYIYKVNYFKNNLFYQVSVTMRLFWYRVDVLWLITDTKVNIKNDILVVLAVNQS